MLKLEMIIILNTHERHFRFRTFFPKPNWRAARKLRALFRYHGAMWGVQNVPVIKSGTGSKYEISTLNKRI